MLFISLRVLFVLFLFIYIVASIYLVSDHGANISEACIILRLRIWLISCVFFLLFSTLVHVLCGDFPFLMFGVHWVVRAGLQISHCRACILYINGMQQLNPLPLLP